jgi:hypothetical protein
MIYRNFFWLHIKKSAGITTRRLLQPHYVEVDRVNKPMNFIQAKPTEYNDILNNYRVVIGEYQFKRALFAKTFLYLRTWDSLCSFAFSRNPVDRCISMFYYLYWQDLGRRKNAERLIETIIKARSVKNRISYAFDSFLNQIEISLTSDSIYSPLGLHFSTHTAPMWDDITDFEGNILLSKVFRLEDLIRGINKIFSLCNIKKRLKPSDSIIENKTRNRREYYPNRMQIRRIEKIFSKDFEIYENARL